MTAPSHTSDRDGSSAETMHVLYVLGQNTGGLPHYTAELANAVAKRVEVTVLKPSETTADDMFSDEVDVRETFKPLNVSLPKLYSLDVNPLDVIRGVLSYHNIKEVKDIDADITHETSDLFPQVKLFTKFYRIDKIRPFVVTRHEVLQKRFPLSQPPVLVEQLVNYALPDVRTDKTIVHTESQRQALVDQGTDPETIEVIPHGAYSVFGTRGDVDADPEQNTLLFFGNITPQKGLDTLVESIPAIKRTHPDVTLIIAGEGTIPRRARTVIDEHPENFEVHNEFVPNRQVKDLFARAEVVVLPYQEQGGTKGHSGTLMTAFSFGKPVVTSTAGDFPTQVRESGAGSVVPPDNPERLTAAIANLLQDEETKERMKANSRKMAERLSWDNIAERHLELYRSVLQRPRARRTSRR